MGISIDTSDVRDLGSRIGTAGGRVGAKGSALHRKTTFAIERDAKIFSAVDTGDQQESISSTITGDGRTGHIESEIGPTTEYSPHQEYGTSTQPGTPFMGPSFDRNIDPYTQGLAQIAAQEL